MSLFGYNEERLFQEDLKNLFENKVKLNKKDLISFLKKDEFKDNEISSIGSEDLNFVKEKVITNHIPEIMNRLLDKDEIVEETQIPVQTGVNMIVAGGGGENNSMIVVGNGVSLYKDKVGPDIRIKSLSASGSTSIIDVGDVIVISSTESNDLDSWKTFSGDYYTSTEVDIQITSAISSTNLEDLLNVQGGVPNDYAMLNYISATSSWSATNIQWDDLRFPLTKDKQGANEKPDFDFTNIGLLFPENNQNEEINIIAQFPHQRKLNSVVRPHIHFVQTGETLPIFIMEYKWYSNGDIIPASFTRISTSASSGLFSYSSGSILQIISFPEIDGTGKDMSSMMDIRMFRQTGDGVTGDVLVKEFDIHYQSDSYGGSRQEFIK
jgi:hypothetical protein